MRVFVTVGTYRLPAQRLVDAAALLTPGHEVAVQWGTADPPSGLAGSPWLGWREQQESMAAADVVVATGGMTPTEALALGRVPVLVPREEAHGEHVDDHQVEFARYLESKGAAVVARPDPESLEAAIREAAAMAPPERPDGGLVSAISAWLRDP